MPPLEEESLSLVGRNVSSSMHSGVGGRLILSGGERNRTNIRTQLYTEEMSNNHQTNESTTIPTTTSNNSPIIMTSTAVTSTSVTATSMVGTTSADSVEHDLIDSSFNANLLAQFHEDAVKQVEESIQ